MIWSSVGPYVQLPCRDIINEDGDKVFINLIISRPLYFLHRPTEDRWPSGKVYQPIYTIEREHKIDCKLR